MVGAVVKKELLRGRPLFAGRKHTRSGAERDAARLPPVGDGSPQSPLVLPVQPVPNRSGCVFCPADTCVCRRFAGLLDQLFDSLPTKRVISCDKRMLCAKSILPPFVSRLVRALDIGPQDTFYDLGSGNGSVLFQVAFMTGARCVGVELSEHNAFVAREAWKVAKPELERLAGRAMPEVTILTGDLNDEIAKPTFASPATVVWTSNLLMPRMVTQHMAERFRLLPSGARFGCLDDFYPHSRALARVRDPEVFELFEIHDHVWAEGTVEWTASTGSFFTYRRK